MAIFWWETSWIVRYTYCNPSVGDTYATPGLDGSLIKNLWAIKVLSSFVQHCLIYHGHLEIEGKPSTFTEKTEKKTVIRWSKDNILPLLLRCSKCIKTCEKWLWFVGSSKRVKKSTGWPGVCKMKPWNLLDIGSFPAAKKASVQMPRCSKWWHNCHARRAGRENPCCSVDP